MKLPNIVFLVYGLLMIIGGFIGYAKAGSKASLIAGVASGILILIGVYLTGSNVQLGYGFLTTVSAVLTIVFIMRLIKTHNFMPSGMLLAMSVIALIIALKQLMMK